MNNPLDKLDKSADVSYHELRRTLNRALKNVKAEIVNASNATIARNRKRLYRKINKLLQDLKKRMDVSLKKNIVRSAKMAGKRVRVDVKGIDLEKWDDEQCGKYWEYVTPENSKSLAAVFTDKMDETIVNNLRRAMVEVYREAGIKGWANSEIEQHIHTRWLNLCHSKKNFKFVDKSGRKWDNEVYLRMLVRTTSQRVYNDAYVDRLTQNGIAFAKIMSLDLYPDCEICKRWDGEIIVLGGNRKGYRTYQEAKDAGVFHPNCRCIISVSN